MPVGRGRRPAISRRVRRVIEAEVTQGRVGLVEVYAVVQGAGRPSRPLVAVESPALPRGDVRASADRSRARRRRRGARSRDARAARWRRRARARRGRWSAIPRQAAVGVVIASDYLSGELGDARAADHRGLREPHPAARAAAAAAGRLSVALPDDDADDSGQRDLDGPVSGEAHHAARCSMLAAGAREIGAGHLDHRIEPETRDEFGSLIEAFNTMAGELAASQRKLERLAARSRAQEPAARRAPPLHRDGARADRDGRRVDRGRRRASRRSTARRCACSTSTARSSARTPRTSSARGSRAARDACCGRRGSGRRIAGGAGNRARSVRAASCTWRRRRRRCRGTDGSARRRGPRVRRRDAADPDAARRGLARRRPAPGPRNQEPADADSAVRRAHAPAFRLRARRRRAALVEECTSTIVGEVESLKALVDEFAQFARMPAPRAVPSDLQRRARRRRWRSTTACSANIRIERRFDDGAAAGPRRRRADAPRRHQSRRQRRRGARRQPARARPDGEPPTIVVETQHDAAMAWRGSSSPTTVPGIPPADRDKLFMPYYSTKLRGSGLGLAIVRRIIVEHGGSIEVARQRAARHGVHDRAAAVDRPRIARLSTHEVHRPHRR